MSKKKQRGEDFRQEDVLQAVVIADSFNARFGPVTEDRPRALIPLVNVALLDYTLEWLCTAGIQEVILFSRSYASEIKRHVRKSKWDSPTSPMEIITIASEDCMSFGDALRDIDAKSLIHNDFVLVNGDIVSNLNIKPLMEEHKQRRLKDKTPIMTMVMKKSLPGHHVRSREAEAVVMYKKETQRVLAFQRLSQINKFDAPLDILKQHSNVQLRYDLLDCQISICSPTVPQLFTDNFDYLTREDFIKDTYDNEEILGNTIHMHIIEEEYAVRVSDLPRYDAVSQDILTRWSYPLVPDANITNDTSDSYMYGRHNIYTHKDITLARGCVLKENVAIGKGTKIGSDTIISHSVIGKNCVIGEKVKLSGAYVWDNVKIENDCTVIKSILDDNVHLLSGVCIQKGSVLARNVVIGPNVMVEEGSMLTSNAAEFEEEGEMDVTYGENGKAYKYVQDVDSDDEDEDPVAVEMMGLNIESADEEVSMLSGSESEDEGSFRDSPPPDEFKMFLDEVIGTLERAMVENITLDNLVVEVNGLKHAYGIQIREVNQLFTKALIELPFRSDPNVESAKYLAALVGHIKKFIHILKNYIRSPESQKDCLMSIEESCMTNSTVMTVVMKILHFLYNADILSEESILKWYNVDFSHDEDTDKKKQVRKQVASFVTWLEEAEEDSDDSEEESD